MGQLKRTSGRASASECLGIVGNSDKEKLAQLVQTAVHITVEQVSTPPALFFFYRCVCPPPHRDAFLPLNASKVCFSLSSSYESYSPLVERVRKCAHRYRRSMSWSLEMHWFYQMPVYRYAADHTINNILVPTAVSTFRTSEPRCQSRRPSPSS